MRALIKTFGCKVNFADGEEIARTLATRGWECVHADDGAMKSEIGRTELVVINSCAVTHTAVAKVRRFIRWAKREYIGAKIAVIGCCARNSEIAAELGLLGVEVTEELTVSPDVIGTAPNRYRNGRSRRFIKVQDGCDSFCAYCIVPFVRHKWDAPLVEISNQIKRAAMDSVAEVVLCGVNIGLYREPDAQFRLADLLSKVLGELPDGMRLRLSSIEPEHAGDELLSLFSNPKMCPHLHIPLQSGSERVLSDMGRRYTIDDYAKAVRSFRAAFPFGAITTDLLVGYPTESDEDYRQTCESAREFGFERVHVFRYSPRPGTRAALLKPLPENVTRERERELIRLCAEVADERWTRFVGRKCVVALESGSDGYGEAYQRVHVEGVAPNSQGLRKVELKRYARGSFTGNLI